MFQEAYVCSIGSLSDSEMEYFSVKKNYRKRSYSGIVTAEMILPGEKTGKITKLIFEDYLESVLKCSIKNFMKDFRDENLVI